MNSYIGFPDGSSNEVQDRVWKGDVSFFPCGVTVSEMVGGIRAAGSIPC